LMGSIAQLTAVCVLVVTSLVAVLMPAKPT
jgi:hypothetical protein